jgi:hypothetical protein
MQDVAAQPLQHPRSFNVALTCFFLQKLTAQQLQ